MTIGQIDSQLIRHLTVIARMNVIKHTTTSKLDLKRTNDNFQPRTKMHWSWENGNAAILKVRSRFDGFSTAAGIPTY